jgi:mannose-6-phosphate isomerase-like protein (cupin superfamily)
MAVVLEGGCRVSTMHDGEPRVSGSLKIWNQIGKATGAKAISLRVLEFGPGTSPVLRNQSCDEVFYVLEGNCTVVIDDIAYELGPETGVYLRPGQTLRVENSGADVVRFVS